MPETETTTTAGLRTLFPSFSTSKFAQRHRPLPPGVEKPTYWLKDQGPLKIEAKVWLANQRTFVKWQHVTVLLASLSLGLYNAAGENNNIARALAVIYTGFAIFAGVWGYWVYMWRASLIRKRSGRDFDNRLGPVIVCGGLAVALILNFAFKVRVPREFKRHEVTKIPVSKRHGLPRLKTRVIQSVLRVFSRRRVLIMHRKGNGWHGKRLTQTCR